MHNNFLLNSHASAALHGWLSRGPNLSSQHPSSLSHCCTPFCLFLPTSVFRVCHFLHAKYPSPAFIFAWTPITAESPAENNFLLLLTPIIFFYSYLQHFVFLSDIIVIIVAFPVFPPGMNAPRKTILPDLSWFLTKPSTIKILYTCVEWMGSLSVLNKNRNKDCFKDE